MKYDSITNSFEAKFVMRIVSTTKYQQPSIQVCFCKVDIMLMHLVLRCGGGSQNRYC